MNPVLFLAVLFVKTDKHVLNVAILAGGQSSQTINANALHNTKPLILKGTVSSVRLLAAKSASTQVLFNLLFVINVWTPMQISLMASVSAMRARSCWMASAQSVL